MGNRRGLLRAQVLEDWGMDTIVAAFPNFKVNKNASALANRSIDAEQPNGCYWQPVRAYLAGIRDFDAKRKQLDKITTGRKFGDLGKRFQHPYGM